MNSRHDPVLVLLVLTLAGAAATYLVYKHPKLGPAIAVGVAAVALAWAILGN
ncbi:hypothetical protein ACFYYS_40465 [Streptomyces sp. NPDC002120]|uniref:hypothetical protein n=1 Tax=Streptomyces sp. NPDC002120 TaxID=3364631 RepID=UPI0036CBB771